MNNIDSLMLKRMIVSAANNLQNNRGLINDYNVFPVPDGDTGTNMSLTFTGASSSIRDIETDSCGEIFSKLASAALRNARGNSGVILSQILRGLAKGTDKKAVLGIAEITEAAKCGRDVAYRAVMKPTEGTILTVVREVAEFAEKNYKDYDDVLVYLKDLLKEAQRSLESTKEILPVLKQAGVVDAGGKGVVTLLEGAVYVLEEGHEIELTDGEVKHEEKQTEKTVSDVDIKYLYCTEFIINKKKDRQAKQFTSAINDKGDCMLVIEDEDIVKVHIHTNHPGFVIEQAIKLGELTNLKIDNMKFQHSENSYEEKETETQEDEKEYGFVAVSAGEGLSEIFKSMNVDRVVEGGQTMNPSTQDLLDAVNKINSKNVFIFPNNKNIIMAAQQVNELTDKNVLVVPTRNVPQGISALIAFNGEASAEENLEAMKDAAGCVSCGQLTYAARDTVLDGTQIKEGDVMGITEKGIEVVGNDIGNACLELVRCLVTDDSGIVTLYYGEGVSKEDAESIKEVLEDEFFELDIELHYGGQPVYYYIVSIE